MPYDISVGTRSVEVYWLGERGSGFKSRGHVQEFEKLRDKCLSRGELFEDPDFPAENSSLFFSHTARRHFEWLRPHELTDTPKLFVEGASRFDVIQGELGDCWLMAAVANLTLNESLFRSVVPHDQSFVDNYAGIFHFRFWQYGRWLDVVVDDRLPTVGGHLVFMHSKHRHEFWSALLEKAYAKLHGCYEALKGGTTCEAMEDFTGGVTEFYELNNPPSNLFTIMLKAYERSSLMGCSIEPDPNITEARLSNGLIRGHAYSVTSVRLVEVRTPRVTGKIPLLRIRNPWGNECEWNGPWGDKSPEWKLTSPEERAELGLIFEDDGEFWMSFKDFLGNFHRVEICNLNPDSLVDEPLTKTSKKKWEMSMYEGSWIRSCTAGGCRNFLETFWMNPQYRVILEDHDEEDDEDLCTMIVALMQKNRRRQRRMGVESLTIGFAIYRLENPHRLPKPLHVDFFKYTTSIGRSPSFINMREVNSRYKYPPGTYCIVPSTYDPNEEGDFVLRVFTEKKNNMTEYDEDIGFSEPEEEALKIPDEIQEKEQQIRDFFTKLAGEDLEVDCYELQQILNFALKKEFNFEGFCLDICRSMVAMLDADYSGKLGMEEFKELWTDIRTWKNVFKKYDMDNSGSLCILELRSALHSAGYKVNNHILQVLVLRYGKDGKLSFDDFIACAVKLRGMIQTFMDKDKRGTGRAVFTMDEWVEHSMYC